MNQGYETDELDAAYRSGFWAGSSATDAQAAEVARLTAERDALRAQLDAAGWRPIHETLPPLGEEVQVRGRGQYVSSAWDVYLDVWRPAPPQE